MEDLEAKRVCLAGRTSEDDGCSRDKQGIGWMEGYLVGWASEREEQQRCPEKRIFQR